MGKEYRIPIIH